MYVTTKNKVITKMQVAENMQTTKDMGIYVHIPFCVRKCLYCDFLSFGGTKRELWEQYTGALCKEIIMWGEIYGKSAGDIESKNTGTSDTVDEQTNSSYTVRTVFFGGGTPSLLDIDLFTKIVQTLKQYFTIAPDAEITIECNPGTVTREKLQAYRDLGINRISFGLQSANDTLLKELGRIHTYAEFLENYKAAREVGFSNINVDLMSGLPGQTLKDWKETLQNVLALKPEHISAYSLIIEEGTPFYERYGEPDEERTFACVKREKNLQGDEGSAVEDRIYPPLPDEETERLMYEETEIFLKEQGLSRYEISNYARSGYESRHNISYWKRTDYLGMGLGAASFLEGKRWHNPETFSEYFEAINRLWHPDRNVSQEETECRNYNRTVLQNELHTLSEKEAMEEFMFLGLRMCEGVDETEFGSAFGVPMQNVYGNVIETLVRDGLLTQTGTRLALTKRGIDVSNFVLAEFLL